MMRIKPLSGGGEVHPIPFVGPVNHPAPVRVLASGLTASEVDSRGWVKSGVLFSRAGALVGAGVPVYGSLIEHTQIADSNAPAALAAAGVVTLIVGLICTINRAVLEDSLGRVLTAEEIAGCGMPGGGAVVLIF